MGANLPNNNVPILEGGVLKDECDHAFWCAFEVFRNEEYHNAMIKDNHQDYIKDRNARFKCDKANSEHHKHEEL